MSMGGNMSKFICTKSGRIGRFGDEICEGREYFLKTNILGECVLIRKDDEPNIITTYTELYKYGTIMTYSYMANDYVEYIPPINYDAYDEYEECEHYI